jgi:hypothetical protein
MSGEDPKNKPPRTIPIESAESDGRVARNGVGVQSALLAMLKRRQMRVSRDTDPPAEEPAKKDAQE